MRKSLINPAFLILSAFAMGHSQLSLSLDGETFLPFEPINISVSYKGPGPVELNPAFSNLRISVEDLDRRTTKQFTSLITACINPRNVVPVSAFEGFEVVGIATDGSQWLFEQPGDYIVSATLNEGLRSNRIRVRIATPSFGKDREWAEKIGKSTGFAMYSYLEGGGHFPDAAELAKQIAASPSSYRSSMRNLLFKSHSQMSMSAKGEILQPDPVLAAQYYSAADTDSRENLGKLKSIWFMNRLDFNSKEKRFQGAIAAESAKLRSNATAFERLKKSSQGKDIFH